MKLFKKSLSVLLTALLLGCTTLVSIAADGDVTVSLRIEGKTACLYYDDVTVPAGTNAMDMLVAADNASDDITLTVVSSDYGPYLAGINDLFSGSVAPDYYDGWMFLVNGEKPKDEYGYECSLNTYTVADSDEIVVYYSDEYGKTGFLVPQIKLDEIADGKLSFTATVTTWDENWNPVTSEVNVTGYTLYWDGEKITPDDDGITTIPAEKLTAGDHSVQIERYAENGLPTVLRYASDFSVNVPAKPADEQSDSGNGFMDVFTKAFNFLKELIMKIVNFFRGLFNR